MFRAVLLCVVISAVTSSLIDLRGKHHEHRHEHEHDYYILNTPTHVIRKVGAATVDCQIKEQTKITGATIKSCSVSGSNIDAEITATLDEGLTNSDTNIHETNAIGSTDYDCAGNNALGTQRCSPLPASKGDTVTFSVSPGFLSGFPATATYTLYNGAGVELGKFEGSISF